MYHLVTIKSHDEERRFVQGGRQGSGCTLPGERERERGRR